MSSNSRYSRLLRAAGNIQVAANTLKALPEGQLDRAMAITRAKATIDGTRSLLQNLALDCAMAKGMYSANRTIRDAIVNAGVAITALLPALARTSEQLTEAAKDSGVDITPIIANTELLATEFASISITPTEPRSEPAEDEPSVV